MFKVEIHIYGTTVCESLLLVDLANIVCSKC